MVDELRTDREARERRRTRGGQSTPDLNVYGFARGTYRLPDVPVARPLQANTSQTPAISSSPFGIQSAIPGGQVPCRASPTSVNWLM